jgi:hypothetical protein
MQIPGNGAGLIGTPKSRSAWIPARDNEQVSVPPMPVRRRIILLTAGTIVVLIALVALAPRFLNPDRYRPAIVSYFEKNSGKKTEISRLALTVFPPFTVHVYGFGMKSPAPFPPDDVVRVAQADAVIDPWALLRGSIVIRSVTLKAPEIHLLSDPEGHWNFENPGARSLENTFPLKIIDRVTIEGGQLTVSNLLPSGAAGPAFMEAHDVATQLSFVNLAAIVNPTSPSLNGQGPWQASRVRFGAVETTGVQSNVRLESWKVSIAEMKAAAYSGVVMGEFSLSLAKSNASVTAAAQIQNVDLAQLLPAFYEGPAPVTGKLEGDLTLAGDIEHGGSPLAGLHATGHMRVGDGRVPSLLSNPDLRRLAGFNDLGPGQEDGSVFSSISADLRLADLWLASPTIQIDGRGVAVSGSGRVRVSGANDLDYRGVATIVTKQGFWTNTFARFAGATLKNGRLSFPFRIAGTIGHPAFSKGSGDTSR